MAKELARIVRRNTAVSAVGALTNPVAGLLAPDVAEGSYILSFDPTDVRNESLLFSVDSESECEAEDFIHKPFPIVNWAAKRVNLTDPETGEVTAHIRVTLIDGAGTTLSFVSIGIAASLDLIRTLRGDGPYDPPYCVYVKSLKTRRGFRLYRLFPAAESDSTESGKVK